MVKLIIFVFTLGIKGAFEVHQFETSEYCRYYAEIMIEQHQIKLPTQVFCCGRKCEEIIAPAYAEVDCVTSRYTGLRFRFRQDPFVHKDWLYSNPAYRWHRPGYGKFGECLYS